MRLAVRMMRVRQLEGLRIKNSKEAKPIVVFVPSLTGYPIFIANYQDISDRQGLAEFFIKLAKTPTSPLVQQLYLMMRKV